MRLHRCFEAVDFVDSLKLIERAGGLPAPLTPPHARLFLAAKGVVYSLKAPVRLHRCFLNPGI